MTIPSVKISNMNSPRTGAPVANQYIIKTDDGAYFQSYQTIIAHCDLDNDGKITLDASAWDYSRTTLKYLYEFLKLYTACPAYLSKHNIQGRINSGEYKIANLN